jgi:hypothetical protein
MGLDRPLRLQEVEIPINSRISTHEGSKFVDPTQRSFFPHEILLLHISVRGVCDCDCDCDGVWSTPRPGCFTPRKDPVPIVQEVGWVPGPVWRGWIISPPSRFDSLTVQPVASCYTDYNVLITKLICRQILGQVSGQWATSE